MSTRYPDPPTWAVPFVEGPAGLEFNPIWLQWFLELAAFVTASGGGGGGAPDHNSLTGLQGGAAGEYYHTTNTQYTELVGNKAANLFYAGPLSGGAAAPAFRRLIPGDIPTGVVIAFGLDGEAGEDALTIPGPAGANGAAGPIGFGLDGENGEDGLMGLPGVAGATGATGAAGADGATGPQGPIGFGMDGDSAESEDLRGFPSGDPIYTPIMTTGASLISQELETVVNLTVPVGYSFVVAGAYIVDGALTVNGDMRII